MLKSIFLLICFCARVLIAQPTELVDELAAKEFIIDSSPKFIQLYNEMAKTSYDQIASFKDDIEKEHEKALQTKMNNIQQNLTELIEEAYMFPVDRFKDEEIKRGILAIKAAASFEILGDASQKWSEDDFIDFLNHKNFCDFKKDDAVEKCDLSFENIYNKLRGSNNPNEILYYWKEIRERNLSEVRKKMKIFLNLYKKYGEKLQMSPKFAWFAFFLDENFDEEMEKVIKELEPLYKDLHAYIRYILREEYGNIVPEHGLIPHHLYEHVIIQIWKRNTFTTKEFEGIKTPHLYQSDGQSVKDMMEDGQNFMKSLGFAELPREFWSDRSKPNILNKHDCLNYIIGAGNITYLIYCDEVSFKRFHHMVADIAEIYYEYEYFHLPSAYSDSYNIAAATGRAISLSAITTKFLHDIGHSDVSELSESEDVLRLFKRGVQTILSVPEYFVHSKVIADVLDDKISFDKINEHYWNLMAKYLGVASPVQRNPDSIDFPEKFYNEIETNDQADNFVTQIMGYQIYEALCNKTGQYPNNESVALHNCNFYKHEEAGEALKHMMQLGVTKSWKQVLGEITGNDNGMTAAAMIEYYSPLQKWLQSKKTEHGIIVGW